MIKDSDILNSIRSDWETVRAAREMVRSNTVWSFVHGHVSSEFGAIKLANNLLLFFAFSVLEDVLMQLRDEHYFCCKNSKIGPLMVASRAALPWQYFDLIDEARNKRNLIAHKRQWINAIEAKKYIDAIENELILWKIVSKEAEG